MNGEIFARIYWIETKAVSPFRAAKIAEERAKYKITQLAIM
jgi:hypothetical protein